LNGLSMKVMNPRGLRHCKLSGRWKIKKRFLSLESDLARNAWALQMETLFWQGFCSHRNRYCCFISLLPLMIIPNVMPNSENVIFSLGLLT
jgi:hypothetical protein